MFFPKFIKIPDVKSRFLQNRLQLLRDIVRASLLNIPFQNITTFGVAGPGPKPVPEFKSIVESAIRGHGGMCAHNNYSLKMFLDSIGYDSYTIASKFRRNSVEGSHVICMVKIPSPFSVDKKTDDLYMIDVGCGMPLHEPIRINDLSSTPYISRAGGLDFAYEMSSDGTVVYRVNKGGDAIIGPRPKTYLNPQDCTILLEPKTFEQFHPGWAKVFGHPETAPHIHNSFYLFKYLDIAPDYSDFKAICIRGKDVIMITKETRTCLTLETYDEVEAAIQTYFPEIFRHEISQAKFNFTQIELQNSLRL